MFRFLRKYNKWILAVGGTLLLIVFLVPQAIQGLSQAAAVSNAPRATIAKADGGIAEVTEQELRAAQRDLEFMQRVGTGVPMLGQIKDPWHWYLLVHEADSAGLIGAPVTGDLDPTLAATLQQRMGMSIGAIGDVLARVTGVSRLITLYQTAGKFSDNRLRSAAEELFEGATVQLVVIEATDEGSTLEPTEAQIREQFEKYPDVLAGEGDTPFGYRLPNRVKLEWLTVPADAVRASIESGNQLSGTELRKHWRRNAGSNPDFPAVPDQPPPTVPEVVREDLLDTLTEERLTEIARTATSQLRARTHGLARDGAYLALPDDWESTRLSFQDLAAALQERYGISLPTYQSSGEWLSGADVAELDGIGGASTAEFQPRVRFLADLIEVAKEFEGSPDVLVQSGVAGPKLTGGDGTLYFFRILDTDASRPPTGPEEVRDQVVADLRRIADYESLVARMGQIEQTAETRGLVQVAVDFDTIVQRGTGVYAYDQTTLQLQTLTGQALEVKPSTLPVIGADEQAVDAILSYVRTLPDAVESLTESQRIFAVPLENKLVLLIGRLVIRVPLTEQVFRERVDQGQIQRVLLNQELDNGDAVREAFSLDALSARHEFQLLAEDPQADGDGTTPSDEATETAE